MKALSEYHEYLMNGRITASLSPEEELDFERLINSDEEIKDTFENFKLLFPAGDMANGFARFKEPGKWRDLTEEFRKMKLRKIGYRVMMAAAVSAGLAITAWWVWQTPDVKQPATAKIVKEKMNEKKLLLTLDNGTVVDLSASRDSIRTTSGTLVNNNRTLSYLNAGKPRSGKNKLSVPPGMDYRILLTDGSVVWLNAATDIEFPFDFDGATREIRINGEAYLEIAKDSKKPFIVHLPKGTVRVLGTEFNVNSYDSSGVTVSLVKGSVKVQSDKKEQLIEPGMEAVLLGKDQIVTKAFNAKRMLSWRKGLYYFQSASLQEISGVIKRWYGIEVVLDNPSITSRKFTGVLDKNKSIQVFMEDIQNMSGIEAYLSKENVLHFKQGN